ncbi:MAG TPA: transglutaminaseTgpA domain-containing protein [Acidimicrobiales bacterium]|nr:transglutaminaseTgpA domain-containing protein [Acidimicrobiales bacterium]
MTSLVERVRRANAPAPAEDSVLFRVATTVAVLAGVLAAESVGELNPLLTVLATVTVCTGMAFSYLTRARPYQWVKLVLAFSVLGVFAFFVDSILTAAHTGELASIEVPLAGLFTWVQMIHAFDVPSRRDLLFSLAAATALVTIAGAQAVSGAFAPYVAVWLVATLVGLGCSWRSMTGGRRAPAARSLLGALLLVLAVALGLLVVLPPPRAARGLSLPASLTSYLPLVGSGIVNGSGPHATEPAKAGRPGGRIGVGGYLGFKGPLDTANRESLGNEVVMRVRADRPGYFLGLTYDTWNGQSWLHSRTDRGTSILPGGSPFEIPTRPLSGSHGSQNVQTFYVEKPLPNLLFGTSQASEVYFPARSLILGNDGSIRTPVAITPGTVYTVVSIDDEVSPAALARDHRPITQTVRNSPAIKAALQLPYRYARVHALARSIVRRAHARSTEAVVQALEGWIGAHTHYSTDIPPLRPGEDAVDEFLFGNRTGYCEQISTALAVMLRTLHIPAREAIGYVPGPFDPLSSMYEIQAKDAHAWVQVYFPGYGWQNFDPTAEVPLAPPNAGMALLDEVGRQLGGLPWTPIGSVAGAGALAAGATSAERRRRRRPKGFAARAVLRLERLGARAGEPRRPTETLAEYGSRLDAVLSAPSLSAAARVLERRAYGRDGERSAPGDADLVRAALAELSARSRRPARWRRRPQAKARRASS